MRDLIGEKTALEQTKLIIAHIDSSEVSRQFYKSLVLKIYDNQLKKWTSYGRKDRKELAKELMVKRSQSVRSPAPPESEASKGLNENQGENMAGKGSS